MRISDWSSDVCSSDLLLETARADFERGPDELELIREQLAHGLKLDAAQTEALIARATDSAGTAVSLHEFVAVLNHELDADGKRELLAWLWQEIGRASCRERVCQYV